MFAVMKTGGKQYKVQSGDTLRVEKLAADAGETVQFNEILMVGGDTVVVGAPLVDGAAVQAEVIADFIEILDEFRRAKGVANARAGEAISLGHGPHADHAGVLNRDVRACVRWGQFDVGLVQDH